MSYPIAKDVDNRIILILLLVTLIKGVVFAFTIPIFKAPDENSHFMYITYLQENKALPYIKFEGVPYDYEFWGTIADERNTRRGFSGLFYSPVNPKVKNFVEENGYSSIPVENFQLPFYYIICAAGSIFYSSDLFYVFYSSRIITVLFGVGLVWISYLIAREVFPKSKFMIYGLPLMISFIPQFTFSASTLGNDVPVAFFVSLIFLQVVLMLKNELNNIRGYFYLGIICGFATITKISALTIFPVIFLFLFGISYVKRHEDTFGWKYAVKCLSVFFLTFGAIVFIPFLHNFFTYGELTGTKTLTDYWQQKVNLLSFDYDNTNIFNILFSVWLIRLIDSFWASFGWMDIWFPRIIYYIFYALMVLGIAGLIKMYKDSVQDKIKPVKDQGYMICFFLMTILSELVLFLKFIHNMGGAQGQGRYFFIVLVPLISLMLYGIYYLVHSSQRQLALTFHALCFGMIAINVFSYLKIVVYYYPISIDNIFLDASLIKSSMSKGNLLILTTTYLYVVMLIAKKYWKIKFSESLAGTSNGGLK